MVVSPLQSVCFTHLLPFVLPLVVLDRDVLSRDVISQEECTQKCQNNNGAYGYHADGRCHCFNITSTASSDDFQSLPAVFCKQMEMACQCAKVGKCQVQVKKKLDCLTKDQDHNIINLSKLRPSKQSSTFGKFKSKYANDGQLLGSVSSTLKQWNPWWEVNFEKMSVVKLVKIYLPVEHYLRLNTYMDLLLIYHPNHWYVCRHISNVRGKSSLEVTCKGKVNVAQFLRMVLGRNHSLQLLEVEILGYHLWIQSWSTLASIRILKGKRRRMRCLIHWPSSRILEEWIFSNIVLKYSFVSPGRLWKALAYLMITP